MTTFTHQIQNRSGEVCSEHKSLQGAEKAQGRLVAMSKGKLTEAAFPIVEVVKSVTQA